MINIKHGQTGLAYMDEHPGPLFSVVRLQRSTGRIDNGDQACYKSLHMNTA